jgi:outer membrane protein assembly factor BamA
VTRRAAAAAALLPLLAVLTQGCYTRADIDNAAPTPMWFYALPYPTYDSDEGLAGHLIAGWRTSSNRRPPPVSKLIGVDARIATSGTRGALFSYDAPGRWKDWRLLGIVGAERLQRVPFYGLGNSATISDSFPTSYYRYSLLRTTALATVQRRISGPLRGHLAVQFRHYKARPLEDSTLFADLLAAGTADTNSRDNIEVRAGLLYDTRDEEASPTKGVFVEAMAARAVSGFDYTRYLLSAREFIRFGDLEQWVLGLRQSAEIAQGTVPVFISYERLTTWYPEDGFGGPTSFRLHSIGRFLAPNRAVFSVDLRHKYYDAPIPTSPVRLWLLGFVDAGRLWNEGEDPSVRNWHWSSGVGARIQLSKSTIIGFDVGAKDGGFGFGMGTSFAF